MTRTEIINDKFFGNSATVPSTTLNSFPTNIFLTDRYELSVTDAFPLDLDLPGEYSTGLSLLKFAGTWDGDDMNEVLDLIKNTRSKTIF